MNNQNESIYKKLTEQEKEDIVKLKKINLTSMQNGVYDSNALKSFFNFWKVHFPKVNQSINCEGCRKTVTKFYHGLADFIVKKQNEAKREVKETPPSKEIKKVKKEKTLTGALSRTGTK